MNKNNKDLSVPMQLGWFVSKISKPFYNRQGFTKKFVIDNWKEIVGEEFSKISVPEKIRIQKGGGILTIATDGATATEMEYIKVDILKKINNYYGYKAVNRLRFRNTYVENK